MSATTAWPRRALSVQASPSTAMTRRGPPWSSCTGAAPEGGDCAASGWAWLRSHQARASLAAPVAALVAVLAALRPASSACWPAVAAPEARCTVSAAWPMAPRSSACAAGAASSAAAITAVAARGRRCLLMPAPQRGCARPA
ncbi:hypothetical protein [Delftia lacustris]|uniref:hypothetical protein n=1 Tax=Delftia lacustris TaxID=558537 RepID=UPI001EF0AACC|nr:hypothetical protein [Delftia lacustris]